MDHSPSPVGSELVGIASDQVPEILAEGSSGIGSLFLSFSQRHPDGADADYLRWHSLDHRPEQYRLAALKASLRVVSTPQCRAARAVSHPDFDAIDHVMTYFFADLDGLQGFATLARALGNAGRVPFVLNPVQRGVYNLEQRLADPNGKAGADVLPWRPARGVYLLLEEQALNAPSALEALVAVEGVAGAWTASSIASPYTSVTGTQALTYLFLDGEPADTAERLKPVLLQRWQAFDTRPLLAAPFHTLVPWEWDRYLP